MVYLERNAFMSELSKLYEHHKKSGAVTITMKRTLRPVVTGNGKLEDTGPTCIVRASDGKKKLACVVPMGEHLAFHMDIFTVIKSNTEALKKPKRNRAKKSKAA